MNLNFHRFFASFSVVCMVFLASAELSLAQINISAFSTIQPSSTPPARFGEWKASGIFALENGLSSYGDPTQPGFFSIWTGPVSINKAVNTGGPNGFFSWNGDANPSQNYGAAFGAEHGNRLTFGAVISASLGTTFNIGQLSFQATSTDVGNLLGFSANNLTYNQSSVGWILNADNTVTYINSGPSSQQVDGVFIMGFGGISGSALAVDSTSPGDTLQNKIDNVGADYGITDEIFLNGTFTLATSSGTYTGSSSFDIVPTPEPDTKTLMGVGLAMSLIVIRKTIQRKGS